MLITHKTKKKFFNFPYFYKTDDQKKIIFSAKLFNYLNMIIYKSSFTQKF